MKRILYLLTLIVIVFTLNFGQSTQPLACDTGSIKLPTLGTAAHSAGDVIDSSLTAVNCKMIKLTKAARNRLGSGGYITSIVLTTDSALSAGTVHVDFYTDSTGMTYIADNAAYAQTFVMARKQIGYDTVVFSITGSSGSGRSVAQKICKIPYICSSSTTAIYMHLSCESDVTLKLGGTLWYKITYDRN
jgi:hypothetical protein